MRPPHTPRLNLRTALVGLLASALAAGGAAGEPAQASPTDALDVSFGGSLVGTTQYTTQGDEAQRGTLHRVSGTEQQVPTGVSLTGGTQGLWFDASSLDLESGNQSFVMETRYTATATPEMATYLSAGGNVFVRAQNGRLRYGYSSNATGVWVDTFKEATLPELNVEHALSLHYRWAESGVMMDVSLDGEALPRVTGASPATVSTGLGKRSGSAMRSTPTEVPVVSSPLSTRSGSTAPTGSARTSSCSRPRSPRISSTLDSTAPPLTAATPRPPRR